MSACRALSHPAAGPTPTYGPGFLMILIIFKTKALCAVRTRRTGEKQQKHSALFNVRKTDLRCVCACVSFAWLARVHLLAITTALSTLAQLRLALSASYSSVVAVAAVVDSSRARDSRSENLPGPCACSPLIALLFVFN